MNEKNLILMDDIMQMVVQADEWQDIQTQDPRITAARVRWEAVLERAKDLLPWELYAELSDAQAGEVAATSDAGILFGIHVADAIRDVVARPTDLSRYVLKRIEARQKSMEERQGADDT